MPFSSRWIVENRVIYTQVVGKLTSQEALEMSEAHARFLDAGTAPVHLVADAKELDSIPINMRQNAQMGQYPRHPSLGWVIIAGGNSFVNFMIATLGQVFHMHYAKRDSLADALSFLATQDASLQFDPAAK